LFPLPVIQQNKDNGIRIKKKFGWRRDSACRCSLRLSRSFKVTDVRTNRKSVCDFQSVNHTKPNLHMLIRDFARYRAVLIKLSLLT